MEEETTVPAFAVTAAVGAVVLLIMLFLNMARKPQNQEEKGFYYVTILAVVDVT